MYSLLQLTKCMLSCHMYSFQVLLLWLICFGPVAPNYFLCIIAVVNFCMHHCNLQFLHYSNIVFLYTTAIHSFYMHYFNRQLLYVLLQFLFTVTSEILCCSTIPIDNISSTNTIINFYIYYWNRQSFMHFWFWRVHFMLMQSTTAVCYIAIVEYSMLQKQYHYQNNCNTLITTLGVYLTCYGLTFWLLELLWQLKMQNMTTEYSNNLNHNNRNNTNTLTTA